MPGYPECAHRKGGAAAAITHHQLCRQADALNAYKLIPWGRINIIATREVDDQ
jgi:hypothetical protein